MQVFCSLDSIPASLAPRFSPSAISTASTAATRRSSGRSAIGPVCSTLNPLPSPFDPHPVRLLRPAQAPRLITPLPMRLDLLAQTGIDATLVIPFTEEFSRLSAHEFAADVLHRTLHAVEVHEGDSFRFGHGAALASPSWPS